MLRDYQQRAIDQLYEWFSANERGNPCLVLPTGAGKSWVVAALCKDALWNWPDQRILMLTHVKELIEQNAEKMRLVWPGAPMGIYSSSIGRRDLGEPITFAGIQSVWRRGDEIGHVDICLIDECHLVNTQSTGMYRSLLASLKAINPALRVIGLTATPWRLGHGMITDGDDSLFHAIIEPSSVEELISKGHLAPLHSKVTQMTFDVSGVHKRGGEFIESELQASVDTPMQNEQAVSETIRLAGNRKAWLFFCVGVEHAYHIRECLIANGITAECVTGETPKKERERILADFKAGKIRALTNANVLTTGFDYPDIDLIALLRPTASPSLYVQMVGRGLRPKSHTDHCLVLDFAAAVQSHGPITAVRPPKSKTSDGGGEAPVKVCDNCGEICHLSLRVCTSCGEEFPPPEQKKIVLHDDDIMGIETKEMKVSGWNWRPHVSRASGKSMVCVTYYGALSDPPIIEYMPILHEGYAGQKALRSLAQISRNAGAELPDSPDLNQLCDTLNFGLPPSVIAYRKDGKFDRVLTREW